MHNLLNTATLDLSQNKEITEILATGKNLRIERIISTGQTTASDFWYDQSENEFVCILQGDAKLLIEDETEIHLKTGDYLLLPAHRRHKVTYTSTTPPCIWLTVFFNNE